MRTLEQVDRAIELARYDMHELMKMRQPISIVGEELLELYEERADILKAMEEQKKAPTVRKRIKFRWPNFKKLAERGTK